jgi:hypothetical protein
MRELSAPRYGSCVVALTTIAVVAIIVVAFIVVLGTRRGGWTSQTGYREYQHGEEALRSWWRRVTGRSR